MQTGQWSRFKDAGFKVQKCLDSSIFILPGVGVRQQKAAVEALSWQSLPQDRRRARRPADLWSQDKKDG